MYLIFSFFLAFLFDLHRISDHCVCSSMKIGAVGCFMVAICKDPYPVCLHIMGGGAPCTHDSSVKSLLHRVNHTHGDFRS